MVEYQSLDDIGQGDDLAQKKENGIAYTLGRHTNDFMTSFYAHSPSGFSWKMDWVVGSLILPLVCHTKRLQVQAFGGMIGYIFQKKIDQILEI